MTTWIHTQQTELRTLGLEDGAGCTLSDRPIQWMLQTPTWTYAWWSRLRRVDRINLEHSRPYYVSEVLGDARLTDESTMPYGTTANRHI